MPFQTLDCPLKDVGLFRVSGVFPTISHDGSMLAFVDNTFRAVWVVDKDGLHTVYEVYIMGCSTVLSNIKTSQF